MEESRNKKYKYLNVPKCADIFIFLVRKAIGFTSGFVLHDFITIFILLVQYLKCAINRYYQKLDLFDLTKSLIYLFYLFLLMTS